MSKSLNSPVYSEPKKTDIHFNSKTLNTSVEKVYKAIIQDSDNLIAESLMLMLSGTEQWQLDTALGIDIIHRQNKMMFENIEQVDGSGLSRNNLLTHKILIRVLKNIYKSFGRQESKIIFHKEIRRELYYIMPPMYNMSFVYAKTGSMKNNNLTGWIFIITLKQAYCFVVSVNNYKGEKRSIQKSIADLLLIISNKMKT